ncbi:MAG: STAS domain-containing protein [Phycisphaerae bacterium]|nr:STAS domain-containing protein [Phycisphaerae bacterium]
MEPEQPSIKIEYGLKVTHVEFADERILDEGKIAALRELLEPAIEKNQDGRMLLNFVNVKFMTSAMLGLLIRVHKKVSERGGKLALCNVDPGIRKVFEITQLTKVLDIS